MTQASVIRRHDRRHTTDDQTATRRHGDLLQHNGPAGPPRPRCELCGEPIGIYEPLVIRFLDGAHRTSFAAEPELLQTEETCYHGECSQRLDLIEIQ